LDSSALDPAVARATLRDIALANRLFGGIAAVRFGVGRVLAGIARRDLVLADVGAGGADILHAVSRSLRCRGYRVQTVALDFHMEAARMAQDAGQGAIRADAFQLPLAGRSVDIVIASQLLHHYGRDSAAVLLAELQRVARVGVVVADLRRTRVAGWGIWIAATVLGFHSVSRTDGVLSVRRGFTTAELAALCQRAGQPATVRRRPGFRLVAYWRADHANG
jgi:SAM-dependent methyltransferase